MNQVSFALRETRVQTVRISKSIKDKQGKLLAENRCLACERPLVVGEKVVRGQCQACYNLSHRKVKAGDYTDSQLIKAGVWLPASPGGRKPSTDYGRRLAEGSI